MKEQINKLQAESVNNARKSIIRDYFDGLALIEKVNDRIAKAIAGGQRFVDCTGVPGAGVTLRYYQAVQFIRSCVENSKALVFLYEDAFGEPMPETDPDLPVEPPAE